MGEADKISGRRKEKPIICEIELGKDHLHLSGLTISQEKAHQVKADTATLHFHSRRGSAEATVVCCYGKGTDTKG